MSVEAVLVVVYLAGCIGVGVWASRKGLGDQDEYWVAGRRVGTGANAMAIMASLASGGSIVGVMGLAYKAGIPYTLALFAGAIVGFPLAAVLVAAPLRRFAGFTITDFLAHRYRHPAVRVLASVIIVVSFTVYIIAQMKAAGITAEVLLGIPYAYAVTLATVVFVLYVSVGGMVAVTWTDIVQGALMLLVVLGTAVALSVQEGAPAAILERATGAAPALGAMVDKPLISLVGIFVLWATAIPVIPHIVMRVFSARDARSARVSLNLAMVLYAAMILAAVLVIVPVGKLLFPELADADAIFLEVIRGQFSPLVRGVAVAAVLAAVMSTTDALLLACSAAVTHDLLGARLSAASERARRAATIAVPWVIGLFAMVCAWSPPSLIVAFYSAAVGLLGASLFVPLVAGLWWKRANMLGGVLAMGTGATVYLVLQLGKLVPSFSASLFALAASAVAMGVGAWLGAPTAGALAVEIAALHRDEA